MTSALGRPFRERIDSCTSLPSIHPRQRPSGVVKVQFCPVRGLEARSYPRTHRRRFEGPVGAKNTFVRKLSACYSEIRHSRKRLDRPDSNL